MDKLPNHFRDKWSRLSVVVDPTNHSLVKILGEASGLSDNPVQGQTFKFANGALVSYGPVAAPFLVYGDIYRYWDSLAGLNSGFGYPIVDPQFLPDGTICSIFEGGHIHRPPGGTEVRAEAFPAHHCPAPDKGHVPPHLARGTPNWPVSFRQKWVTLSTQRDVYGKLYAELMGPADGWPGGWAGLTENENGGRTLHFRPSQLVSYDLRTPPFLLYGKIFGFWNGLGGVRSGLGHPLADPQILEDGSLCCIFEGGHVHQIGSLDAEIFPESDCTAPYKPALPIAVAKASPYWPPHFRKKWTAISMECDATGKQFGSLLGPTDCFPGNWPGLTDNDNGGKTLYFRWGRFISNTFQSPPFVFFGQIFQLWNDFGGLNSGFGYPLADPQILPDGSICSIFEGGHIHQTGTNDAEVVPASECTAENQPVVSRNPLNVNKYWPAHFRSKWASVVWKRDPSGKQLIHLLGPPDNFPGNWGGLKDNEEGGKTLYFRYGKLVSFDEHSSPILVYGSICGVWEKLGGIKSDFKYPLADPQFLHDESICIVFEGGHIHQPRGSQTADVFPVNDCRAPHKPTSRLDLIHRAPVRALDPIPQPPTEALDPIPQPPGRSLPQDSHQNHPPSQDLHPYPPPPSQEFEPYLPPLENLQISPPSKDIEAPPLQDVGPPPQGMPPAFTPAGPPSYVQTDFQPPHGPPSGPPPSQFPDFQPPTGPPQSFTPPSGPPMFGQPSFAGYQGPQGPPYTYAPPPGPPRSSSYSEPSFQPPPGPPQGFQPPSGPPPQGFQPPGPPPQGFQPPSGPPPQGYPPPTQYSPPPHPPYDPNYQYPQSPTQYSSQSTSTQYHQHYAQAQSGQPGHPGHGGFMTMVGRGFRTLGSGMTHVADSLDKQAE